MKSLTGALLATLLGVALLAAGVMGAAGVFDSDEEDPSPDVDFSASAEVPGIDPCPADGTVEQYESYSVNGPGADGTVIVRCEAGNRSALFSGSDMFTDRPRVVALWLYRTRRDFELVSTSPQDPGDDTAIVTGPVPSEASRFRKWIVTEQRAGQDSPEKPGKILLQAEI